MLLVALIWLCLNFFLHSGDGATKRRFCLPIASLPAPLAIVYGAFKPSLSIDSLTEDWQMVNVGARTTPPNWDELETLGSMTSILTKITIQTRQLEATAGLNLQISRARPSDMVVEGAALHLYARLNAGVCKRRQLMHPIVIPEMPNEWQVLKDEFVLIVELMEKLDRHVRAESTRKFLQERLPIRCEYLLDVVLCICDALRPTFNVLALYRQVGAFVNRILPMALLAFAHQLDNWKLQQLDLQAQPAAHEFRISIDDRMQRVQNQHLSSSFVVDSWPNDLLQALTLQSPQDLSRVILEVIYVVHDAQMLAMQCKSPAELNQMIDSAILMTLGSVELDDWLVKQLANMTEGISGHAQLKLISMIGNRKSLIIKYRVRPNQLEAFLRNEAVFSPLPGAMLASLDISDSLLRMGILHRIWLLEMSFYIYRYQCIGTPSLPHPTNDHYIYLTFMISGRNMDR